MLAHAFLAVATAIERDHTPAPDGLIELTVNEFRHLFDFSWTWVDTGLDIRNKPHAIVRGDVEDTGADDLRINLWVAGDNGNLWERYWNGSSWTWVDTGADVTV